MVIFNKKWKKYSEIQLTKNIMDLNIRKPETQARSHLVKVLHKINGYITI